MKLLIFISVLVVGLCVGCDPINYQNSSPSASAGPTASPDLRTPSPTQTPVADVELQKQIAEIAKEAKGTVGVYAVEIETNRSAALDENGHYAMQSVVKVPISMAVLKMADEGRLNLDQLVNVEETDFASANQRSPIRNEFPLGTQMTVQDLMKNAVVESDGTASDVLQRIAGGATAVQTYVDSIGVSDIKIVWSHKEFGAEWSRQYDNWLTPRAGAELLKKLWSFSSDARTSDAANGLSKQSADLLLRFMTESKNPDDRILGLLPAGTPVAHKTGTGGTQNGVTSALNDVGIITMPNGNHVVIAVLVGDSTGNHQDRAGTIAKIAKAVFDKWSGAQRSEPVKSANFNERHTIN
jgi:beta-lactamase class A